MRILRRFLLAVALLLPGFLLLCQALVFRAGYKRTFDNVAAIPARKIGLVLGTNPTLANGSPNAFFEARLNAAGELFHAGKVQRLLLSGNREENYDEPKVMKAGLLARGVPEHVITMDFAGFRTLDSIIRARDIFGVKECTIISQKFHNERALLIARHAELDAIAFNAPGIATHTGVKVSLREAGARVLAVLDLYVLGTPPRFLGKKQTLK